MSQDAPRVKPLTMGNWDDLEALFGRSGADAGCWCMYWRITGREFEQRAGRGNRAALKGLVADSGDVAPGLLAYSGSTPIGWCSLGPREVFGRLGRSPHLRHVDDEPAVWALVCFYVARGSRGQGVSRALLAAAVDRSRSGGAAILEGYPSVVEDDRAPSSALYQGTLSMFLDAGFVEVTRRAEQRPIMRRRL